MKPEFRGVHAAFLADETTQIDLEGARYSGKTWVCCAKVIESCLKYPGIEWLICRYSGEETKTKIRPEFRRMCQAYGVAAAWMEAEQCYVFPDVNGKRSRVYAYGLRTQSIDQELAKIRGLAIGCLWNDQSEELPKTIFQELPFATRQPGYPHQIILSPNPVTENHYLTDEFPENNSIPNRKYYRVSLDDNAHNLTPEKIEEIAAGFPITHPKYKSLVLGQRGVNVVGEAVYGTVFTRDKHLVPAVYDAARPVLEAIQHGQHHPVWMAAQRNYWGGMNILGAVMGKRMFLEDFMPILKSYRASWFPDAIFRTCCDPPPEQGSFRYTNDHALRLHGFAPVFRLGANSPVVREAVIQSIAAAMRQPKDSKQAFKITDDPSKILMAANQLIVNHRFVVEGFESGYVWSPHTVSVANKLVRQPNPDEWIDGAQRCLENIWLNFCADQKSDYERDREDEGSGGGAPPYVPHSVYG